MSALTPNTTAKNAASPANTMRPVTRNSVDPLLLRCDIVPSRSAEVIGRARSPPGSRIADPERQPHRRGRRQRLIGVHEHADLAGLVGADRNNHAATAVALDPGNPQL